MSNDLETDVDVTDTLEPLAIVGFSLKFPGEADTADGFWKVLMDRKCVMREWPEERFHMNAFYHEDASSQQKQTFPVGAHFFKEDPGLFDAGFFNISPLEATAMDPQHRILLEATYHALENAGIRMEDVKGKRVGVYTGSMAEDYRVISSKDVDEIPKYSATGASRNMIANRISWFYDFLGPSLNIDTACSSSLTALHLACQSLQTGESDMTVVAGASMCLAVEDFVALTNMGFVSPDGKCYSFDHRANGYSKGEGCSVVLMKRLSDAIRHGDTIRAVVRATGSNQDGRTPGITQPSGKAQAQLIRETYAKAGLTMSDTRFFEAHGTGTAIGDPIEANAIGSTFRSVRSPADPLYVGALKSNIGHLEGGSGLAAIIKTVMILENALITPNANFEQVNPAIDAEFLNIKFPTESIQWPHAGLRRASISSFGFGGSNAHVILDDALHYMQARTLRGNHRTRLAPAELEPAESQRLRTYAPNGHRLDIEKSNRLEWKSYKQTRSPRLLVFSAADEGGIERVAEAYQTHFQHSPLDIGQESSLLDEIACTLTSRRTTLAWRSFAVISNYKDLLDLSTLLTKANRPGQPHGLAFVFTGQGAQYKGMGATLVSYPIFRDVLDKFDRALAEIGCDFSVVDLLLNPNKHDFPDINDPAYSQPMTTAIQLALIKLLYALNVVPSAVCGHSSGEIAAAYAAGAISLESACKVSYYRGRMASDLVKKGARRGAMLSINLSRDETQARIERSNAYRGKLHVACINSPLNVTVSGDEAEIDKLNLEMDQGQIFARKLNTGVAYHSPHMNAIADDYVEAIAHLEPGVPDKKRPALVSSLTGKFVRDITELCAPQYWVMNMVSPVNFADAMSTLMAATASKQTSKLGGIKSTAIQDVIEVGPHSALRRPVLETIDQMGLKSEVEYFCTLDRNKPAADVILNVAGQLFLRGQAVDVARLHMPDSHSTLSQGTLFDLPSYPFNHSRSYWHESALSRHGRRRNFPKHELLGAPTPDWNPFEARWRKYFDITETPWIADHKVNDKIIYPATGMVVMAVEAANQLSDIDRSVIGFQLRDVKLSAPIAIDAGSRTEVHTCMRHDADRSDRDSTAYTFRVYTHHGDEWITNCQGHIQVQYESGRDDLLRIDRDLEANFHSTQYNDAVRRCRIKVPTAKMYAKLAENGLNYGPAFKGLDHLGWDGGREGVGHLKCFKWNREQSGVARQQHIAHPATLDAAAQLVWVSLLKGATKVAFPGVAVTRIQSVWISSSGLSYPGTEYLRAYCQADLKGTRGSDSSLVALDQAGNPQLIISHLETTAVGGQEPKSGKNMSREICFDMQWKPDVALLKSEDLRLCTPSKEVHRSSLASSSEQLEQVQYYLAAKAVHAVAKRNIQGMKPHLKRYLDWLQLRIEEHKSLQNGTEPATAIAMESLADHVERGSAVGRLSVEVGRNLPGILADQVDLSKLINHSGLSEQYYAEVCEKMPGRARLQTYIAALAHKIPGLRMLEVGAGGGPMTSYILDALQDGSPDVNVSLARYDYTDLSEASLNRASERFTAFQSMMTFRTLNIEIDPVEQGFEAETYDVVVAAWVFQEIPNMNAAVRNARKLLKPGGKFVVIEATESKTFTTGFAFATLPEWWQNRDEDRMWSPYVSEERWGEVLIRHEFDGIDICLADGQDSVIHEHKIMIANAKGVVDPREDSSVGLADDWSVTIVHDPASSAQQRVKADLEKYLSISPEKSCSNIEIDQIHQAHTGPTTFFIFLVELERSFLKELDKASFLALQQVITTAGTILWVSTATSPMSPCFADKNMINGLARVIHTERPSLRFVTLALEDNVTRPGAWTNQICKIYEIMVHQRADACESEYVEREGLLTVNRVFQSSQMNRELTRRSHASVGQDQWFGGPPLVCSIANPGLLDSIHFVEDMTPYDPLGPEDVEIKVQAVGLNFRDLLIALGKLSAQTLGYECSGIITRVGSTCSTFSPGQRVCAAIKECTRTLARCNWQAVAAIPDSISIVEAASIPITGVAAYHSLIRLANLQRGETVLIHSAAGATGQMAVQIAQSVGAVVFVTVGTEEKKRLMMDIYGIAKDHIFASRDTSFARDVLRMTNGKGVDVVLNSLAGQALTASWELMAPFGRFLELGVADIESNSKLPMLHFRENVSYFAVALHHIMGVRDEQIGQALKAVFDMLSCGSLLVAQPLIEYPITKLEDALRVMQSGKSVGKTVLTIGDADRIKTYLHYRPTYSFDKSATYLIAGGLGGLGRSAARWMVQRGARNLILLSRSGPTSSAQTALLSELTEKGVRVETPRCDVSDQDSLSKVLQDYANMPPIKGCVQATMVLQDALYDTMTWEQWSTSITSKVQSTWNLHELLPADLSFFIMLSSVAGVAGSMGQSNYAAGNTYQDALARHRLAIGRRAVSIDLGWMADVGVVAESASLTKGMEAAGNLAQMYETDFLALLDYYCNPLLNIEDLRASQPILGLVTLKQLRDHRVSPPEWLTTRPMFKPLAVLDESSTSTLGADNNLSSQERQEQELAAIFLRTKSDDDRATIVAEALVQKLSRATGMPAEEFDRSRPLHAYGVDSLLAVELRNWFAKLFKADVAVFDLTGPSSLEKLATDAASASALKSANT